MTMMIIGRIQDWLSFKHCKDAQFSGTTGIGRVAVLAVILGFVFGIHLTVLITMLTFHSSNSNSNSNSTLDNDERNSISNILIIQWCLNICFVALFHLTEFFVTAIYNSSEVSAESFMVNHSKAYTIAMLASWVEFWAEYLLIRFYLGSQMYHRVLIMPVATRWVGLVFVLGGQCLRTAAMATCGPSFNHLIQRQKKSNHVLITHGVYAYFRHPSYVGWFFWSIGTQLILLNPFTSLAFTLASLDFFRKRIPYEEMTLLRHFGDDYRRYMEKTYMGIPFIPRTDATSTMDKIS